MRTSPLAVARACKYHDIWKPWHPYLLILLSEYDFFTFNSIGGNGTVMVNTLVAPTLNAFGLDRPVAVAVQVDSQPAQTSYFIPPSAPGGTPPGWDGNDGFVVRFPTPLDVSGCEVTITSSIQANSIVTVSNTFPAAPGAHTLKVRDSPALMHRVVL